MLCEKFVDFLLGNIIGFAHEVRHLCYAVLNCFDLLELLNIDFLQIINLVQIDDLHLRKGFHLFSQLAQLIRHVLQLQVDLVDL